MIILSLLVLGGLAAAALLRRRSAALRHWVLTASLGCAAVAPLLQVAMPAWPMPMPMTIPAVSVATVSSSTPPPHVASTDVVAPGAIQSSGLAVSLSQIWLSGAVLGAFLLLAGLARVRWIASRAVPIREGRWADRAGELAQQMGVHRPLTILQSDHPSLLVTYGTLRPRVVVPCGAADWPDDRIRIVLVHELAHVRRGDWPVQLLAEALRCAHWFNPLLWIAARRLRQEAERACDDEVLAMGIEDHAYAAHLLALAREARAGTPRPFTGFPAPAMVRASNLERRITAMLDRTVRRSPVPRRTRLLIAAGCLTAALFVAGLGAAAQAFATFSGTVLDPAHAATPNVTLKLTHLQSQTTYEVRSDETGQFAFAGLPPGDYEVEAQLTGFRTARGTVRVNGRDVQQDVALEIGSLQETVTVAGRSGGQTPAPTEHSALIAPRTSGAPATPSCTPVATGGSLRAPRKTRHVRPVYPRQLVDEGVGGEVVLHARIDADGRVRDVAAEGVAHPDLQHAAIAAVEQWRFEPTLLNCEPIGVDLRARIVFEAREVRVMLEKR